MFDLPESHPDNCEIERDGHCFMISNAMASQRQGTLLLLLMTSGEVLSWYCRLQETACATAGGLPVCLAWIGDAVKRSTVVQLAEKNPFVDLHVPS